MKIYYVTFEKHLNCKVSTVFFHCLANNATEAKQIARDAWQEAWSRAKKVPYQFHLYAHRSNIQEADKLSLVDVRNRRFTGEDVMNHFHSVDSRTWRIDGINQYGCNAGLNYRL